MTYEEYIKKLENYKCSSAPVEVTQKAIAKLKEEYYGIDPDKREAILKDIAEGAADISDIKS